MVANLANATAAPASAAGGTSSGAAGGIGGLLAQIKGAAGGCKDGTTTCAFLIHGTASDPKFIPDVGGLAAGMLKSQLACAGTSTAGTPRHWCRAKSGRRHKQPGRPLQKEKALA